MNTTLLVVLLLFAVGVQSIRAPPKEIRKQLQGPPSEFASLSIPSPAAAALRGDSAIVPFTLSLSSDGKTYIWSAQYPVDTPDRVTVSVLSPAVADLTFYLKPPSATAYTEVTQEMFEGPNSIGKKGSGEFGIDGNTVPSYSYTFFNPELGVWSVEVHSSKNLAPIRPGLPIGYLVLDNVSPYKLLSHLNTYELDQGEDIGLAVRMYHEEDTTVDALGLPTAIQNAIDSAKMAVTLPNGKEIIVNMVDDGAHNDLAANDGVYGATIEATEAGRYVFEPIIHGTNPEGYAYFRTVSHLVQVNPLELTLTGKAQAEYIAAKKMVQFELGVNVPKELLDSEDGYTVRAYAEIWGTNAKGALVPVGWAQSMVDPVAIQTFGQSIVLDLDERWVQLAGAQPPFELRNVVIQDRNTNGILESESTIPVSFHESLKVLSLRLTQLYAENDIETLQNSIPVTEDMRYGPRPSAFMRNFTTHATLGLPQAGGKLILVHGYCSGDMWPLNDFTNAVKFEDYQQSRSQDEFALLVKKFADPFGSYSIVAHSQGGLASLHLKTYYWSGLDQATGGRLIQSVGSPYRGCSLAGSLASIGAVFGVGCSSNFDLSPDGASLWISKVPKEPQNSVYYYTTKYTESWWLFTSCVTASGLVMHAPNDGTCEIKFSTPDKGGNNMGTKEGWCHTTGMNYPSQATDKTRNSEMNSKAAR